jgi:outer membrane protein insertion porin family
MKGFLSTLILISSINILFPGIAFTQRVTELPKQEQFYKRPVVDEVVLNGVYSFGQSQIKKLLYTKPNHWYNALKKRYLSKSNVRIDETTIRSFYARRGYLATDVQSDISYPKGGKAVVTFYVLEGKRTTLSGAVVEGGLESINRKFSGDLSTLKIGKPVNAEDVVSNGFRLRDLYADNGYPYAIDSSSYSFSFDSTMTMLTYGVAESIFTINDTTRTSGKLKTRPYVIYREIVARPGKMYRQKDLVNSEQRLYSTGLFRFVSLRRNDSTAVIKNDTCRVGFNLALDERKTYFWGLGLGLGNQQLYNMVLRTSVQGGIRNIAGTGRGVVFSIKPYFRVANTKNGSLASVHLSDLFKKMYLTMVSSDVELDYIAPWLFKYRVPVTAKILYEPNTLFPGIESSVSDSLDVPAYRFDRVSGNIIFSRDINRFTTSQLTASADYVKIRNVPPDLEAFYRDQGNNQIRRRLLLYVQRDTRDNILIPQKGSYSFGGVEYVGGILGGDFNYNKMQFSWSRYRSINGSSILAARIWVGWINDLFKKGRSAIADRFLIGGSTTIRGYAENGINPDGGRYMLVTNAEIRRPLFWRFGGTAFIDAGNAYNNFSDITPISVRFSTGLGVQFFTPVGPIRLDYAVRLKKEFDLSAGLFHLAILYAF